MKEQTTLEYIKECIKTVQETDEFLNKLCDLKFDAYECITSVTDIIELIEWLVYDTYGWFGWFAFEKEYGLRTELKAYEKDNTEIPTNTIEDILDIIEQNVRDDIAKDKKVERDVRIIERAKKSLQEEKDYLNKLKDVGIDISEYIKTTKLVEDFLEKFA